MAKLYTLRDPESILGNATAEDQKELKKWFKTETLLGEEPTVFSVFIKDGMATLTAKNRQYKQTQTVSVQQAFWDKTGFRYLLLTSKMLILLKPAKEG